MIVFGLAWPALAQEQVNGNEPMAELWRQLHRRVEQLEHDQTRSSVVIRYVRPANQTELGRRTQALEWQAQQQRAALEQQQQISRQQATTLQRQALTLQQQRQTLERERTAVQWQQFSLQRQSSAIGDQSQKLAQQQRTIGQQNFSLWRHYYWLQRLEQSLWWEGVFLTLALFAFAVLAYTVANLWRPQAELELTRREARYAANGVAELRQELRRQGIDVEAPAPQPQPARIARGANRSTKSVRSSVAPAAASN